MANNYESLKTDGHYTLAYRIFLKMRNWVQSKVQTDVPANAVFTDTLPTAYCDSAANATAKVAQCTGFSLKDNSYIPINFTNGNTVTKNTGVTLNINNTGAKPLYVNWIWDNSIPTDSPFNAGTYIIYYVNNEYYLYTSGTLYPYRHVAQQSDLKYYSFGSQDGSVVITEGSSTSGGAITYTENMSVQKVNGHTVEKDVPSNAVFTDYKSKIKGSCQGLDHTEHIGTVVFNDSDFEVSPGIIDPFGNSSASVTLLHSVGTDVPSNAVFTDTTYTAGDNVNISQQNVISSDQIEDSYNYQQYQNLPSSTKMQDKLFIVDDAPDLDPAILNLVYPVGTYYETSDTTFNPNVTWGGTWVLEDEGLVHISSGTNYVVSTNAQDGGSAQITYTPSGTNSGGAVQGHKLVASEIPKFAGSAYFRRTSGGGDIVFSATGICSRSTISSSNTSYNQIASSTVAQRDQLNINFGGDGTHNHGFTNPTFTGTQATLDNMQPYKIVNRWHRTA